jgi:hypothetical protein
MELAVGIISSTYKRRYAVEEPWCSIKREVPNFEPRNPSLARKAVNLKNMSEELVLNHRHICSPCKWNLDGNKKTNPEGCWA